jgi:ribose transport system substrate-binding protein
MAQYIDTALNDFPLVGGTAPRRIGYVVNFSFHIWYKVVQEYMSARAKQYGTGELLFRDAQQDLRTQLSAIDDLLAQQVDALIVTPVPGPGTEAVVQKARAAGIPLVIEANPVAGMSTMVAICDYDAGVKTGIWAGEYARATIGDSLAVLDIAYPPLRPCVLRSDGFLDGLRSVVPGAKLAERVNGEAVIETAQRESTRALQRHPEINMMFAMDDESLQGGLLAARDLGRSERGIVAVGFGLAGDEAKYHLLHADAWKASLSMFPEWVGARCVDQTVRLLNNHSVQVHDVVPTICVSRDMMTTYFTEREQKWYPNFKALLAITREDRCSKV